MAENTDSPKTEAPTPRRRHESRRKGQVAFSADLSNGLALLTGSTILWFGGGVVGARLAESLRTHLLRIGRREWSAGHTTELAQSMLGEFLGTAGLLAGAMFLVALVNGFLQAGFHLSTDQLKIDWQKVSLTSGWSRLFSLKSAVRGGMTLGKAAVAVGLVWWLFQLNLDEITWSGSQSLLHSVSVAWSVTMKAAMAVGGVFLLLGIVDYAFQRWKHEQDLRMTRQEIKDEHKQEEGDPQLRARIRKLQREVSQRRMMSDVAESTLILTNPTHLAVAIRYDRSSMGAPLVVAKGADHVAQRIVSIARDHGIPIVEHKPLARTLFKAVDVGQQIPMSLYRAVAEILARIYGLRPST